MCPRIYPPFHLSSLSNGHWNESWVWYDVSGFCDTITIETSPGLLLVILVLIYLMEILQLWNSHNGPFIHSNYLWMIWVLGIEPTQSHGSETGWVSTPDFPYSHNQGKLSNTVLDRPASVTTKNNQNQLFCSCALGANSAAPIPPWPTPLCFTVKASGWISQVL